MCSICKNLIQDFGVEHTESRCPLRNSRYCSYCAQYGHLTKMCPAKPSRKYREPCYQEQLIPYSELKEKNITTRTPIRYDEPDESQRLLKIEDSDKSIIAYMAAHDIRLQKGYTRRQLLEEYAKVNNMRLVYVVPTKNSIAI